MLICKETVRFKRFTPAMLHMLRVLGHSIVVAQPPELVITSANDGQHDPHSRHYTDEALDIRVHNFPQVPGIDTVAIFVGALQQRLGPQFTVLVEDRDTPNAHIHIQVKRGHVYMAEA
jgi:hypothetical protein